jgi:hypothetical protein
MRGVLFLTAPGFWPLESLATERFILELRVDFEAGIEGWHRGGLVKFWRIMLTLTATNIN